MLDSIVCGDKAGGGTGRSGLDRRPMAAARPKNASEARRGSTIQARTCRAAVSTVATLPHTIGTRAAQVRGCTSQCFVSLILHGRQRPKRCRNATSKRRTRGVEMGCAPSKQQQKPPSPQKRDFREQLVWERSGRKFCEVYELLKDLNSGSFGTVALCRRKADGNRVREKPVRTTYNELSRKRLRHERTTCHNGRLRLNATRNELRHEIDVLRKVDAEHRPPAGPRADRCWSWSTAEAGSWRSSAGN